MSDLPRCCSIHLGISGIKNPCEAAIVGARSLLRWGLGRLSLPNCFLVVVVMRLCRTTTTTKKQFLSNVH